MPDYKNGIDIPYDTTSGETNPQETIVPFDGLFVGHITGPSASGESDARVMCAMYDETGAWVFAVSNRCHEISGNASLASVVIPVPKGYKIRVNIVGRSGSTIRSKFFPYK